MQQQQPLQRVVIIQQGAFAEDKVTSANDDSISISPLEVHSGFVKRNDLNGTWIEMKVIGVTYKHNKKNQEVSMDIPININTKEYHLGYFMKMYTLPKSRTENFATENRFINLDNDKYEGTYVQLPISNICPFPWKDNQFLIQIQNLKNPKVHVEEKIQFSGRVTVVYYGFSNKSIADYLNDRDLPWSNYLEEFRLEGSVQVYHVFQNPNGLQQHQLNNHHNNSSNNTTNNGNGHSSNNAGNGEQQINEKEKGNLIMNEIWVRVPKGKNILWRIGYDRFDDHHGKSIFGGHFESESLFNTPTIN